MSVYPPTPSMSMMHGMEKRAKAKRPPNSGSRELTHQENEMLFQLVGTDSVSLTAAVVQLLKSDRGSWRVDIPHGVISLVKDYTQRAYFLRIYDILNERLVWDFKLYRGFRAESFANCAKLLAFEQMENGHDGVFIGLNFHSAAETADFKEHLDRRHAQERKSTAQKAPQMIVPTALGSTPSRGVEITPAYGGGTIRGPPQQQQMGYGNSGGITPMGTMAAHHIAPQSQDNSKSGWFGSKKDKKKKDKKQRIKKEDISNPTNFQHKAHVGWDQDSGFSNKVYDDDMDESTRSILEAAGLETKNLNEKDKKFVRKFIAQNYDKYVSVGDTSFDTSTMISSPMPPSQTAPLNAWNQTPVRARKPTYPSSAPIGGNVGSPMAPPPPARVESHGIAPARPPPPPPASSSSSSSSRGYAPSRPLPQAPSTTMESRPHGVPPPPPPPPPGVASVPPPPPPPPPMPIGGIAPMATSVPPPPPPPPPPPAGGPPNILAALPTAQPGRSNLLAEIQAGKQLKSVSQSSSSAQNSGGGDARGDVMAQIRQGAQLKHVDAAAVEEERRKSQTQGIAGMGGLAGALAKALEERRMNMGIDDSSEEEEDEDEKNEWSD